MRVDLENKLYDDHWIIRNSLVGATIQNSALVFGMECGDGWYKLLDDLCAEIESLIVNKYPWLKSEFRILQIKEKYGGLRFYIGWGEGEIFDTIGKYEKMSYNTCERCGNYGETKDVHGWYTTLCEEHYNESIQKENI